MGQDEAAMMGPTAIWEMGEYWVYQGRALAGSTAAPCLVLVGHLSRAACFCLS